MYYSLISVQYLLCIILFSKQICPLLASTVTVNNQSYMNDSDSLSSNTNGDWRMRVINGFPAILGDVPYQIALKTLIKRSTLLYKTFCGAAIIGPRKLLTAAHCFDEKVFSNCNLILHPGKVSSRRLREVYAVAGNLQNLAKFDSGGQWRQLENVQFPKSYNFPKDDIAVIVLFDRLSYNKHVGPIPMASQEIDYHGSCLVSGYGRTGPTQNSDHSPVLLLAHLVLIPQKVCSKVTHTPREKFVCTATWFTDVGLGDSGGPLACSKTGDPKEDKTNGLLAGILSGTIPEKISLFTRVSSYKSFIDSKTLPLLGNILRQKLVNNNSFPNDPESLSLYAKYELWNPRVINGWEAKYGDVPYQVALKLMISRSKALYFTVCGAAIVGPRKLISAAHCFEEKVISKCNKFFYPGQVSKYLLGKMFAVAGTLQTLSRYDAGGQWRKLKKVIYPKAYDFPEDDIAVIVLKNAYTFNDHVGPIPMASQDIDYQGKCLVSGFGKIGPDDDSENSPGLLLAYLSMIPNKMCSVWHGDPMDDFICASVLFADVGEGDSGGPLVCMETGDPNEGPKGVLVGVVCGAVVNKYSLFTRISRYNSFINSINSVTMPMYKYNKQSCTAITVGLIYKIYKMFLHL